MEAFIKRIQNKRPMGHDSLTRAKQPLHIYRYHAAFFQYHEFNIQNNGWSLKTNFEVLHIYILSLNVIYSVTFVDYWVLQGRMLGLLMFSFFVVVFFCFLFVFFYGSL